MEAGSLVSEEWLLALERKAFIDLPYRLNAGDPHWVPPLRADVEELLNPAKNPFFEHAEVQLFLARRGGQVVGRISAHMDKLAWTLPPEQGMGPGTGNWGLFEAEDEAVASALIAAAEDWLRARGMSRVLAPLSLSIWDEPGLLVKGFEPWMSQVISSNTVRNVLTVTNRTPASINRLASRQHWPNRVMPYRSRTCCGSFVRSKASRACTLVIKRKVRPG